MFRKIVLFYYFFSYFCTYEIYYKRKATGDVTPSA